MALVWQPQEAAYLQLCQLLSDYQNPGANQALVGHWSNILDFEVMHFMLRYTIGLQRCTAKQLAFA